MGRLFIQNLNNSQLKADILKRCSQILFLRDREMTNTRYIVTNLKSLEVI